MRLSGPHGTLGLDAGAARAVSPADAASTVPAAPAAPLRKPRRSIGHADEFLLFTFVDSDIEVLRFELSQRHRHLLSDLIG